MKIFVSEDGGALLEFSLILPLLITILVGIVDLGFAIQQAIIVSDAAHAGTLYASTPGNGTNIANMKSMANAAGLSSFKSSSVAAINLYTCSPGGAWVDKSSTCSGGALLTYAQVTTSASVPLLMEYSGLTTNFPVTFNGSSVVRVQ